MYPSGRWWKLYIHTITLYGTVFISYLASANIQTYFCFLGVHNLAPILILKTVICTIYSWFVPQYSNLWHDMHYSFLKD
jgi:hypothetical protein